MLLFIRHQPDFRDWLHTGFAPTGQKGPEQPSGLQVPEMQASPLVQSFGLPPTQAPPLQLSLSVHWLPSLQALPFDLVGLEHWPVDGLQVPAT